MQDLKELLFILLVIAVFIAGVQWILLKFTNWSVALAATAFISFVIGSLYVALKHATPNGGSNGPDFSEYITPILLVFTVLFFAFLLVCYLTQYTLPRTAYIFPLGSIALFVIVRFGYQEIKGASLYYEFFSDCEISVEDKAGGTSTLNEISFRSSSSSIVIGIDLRSEPRSESRMVRFADIIAFRSTSTKNNMPTRQEFPFDYSMLKEEQRKGLGLLFWIHPKRILPIRLVLQPHDKVDLYVDDHFIRQYPLIDSNSSEN